MVDHIARSTAAVTGVGGNVDREGQAGVFGGGPEHAGRLRGQRRQVGGLPVRVQGAGLGAGEVQQRIDHGAQPLRGPDRRLQVLPFARRPVGGRGEQVLQRGQQQGQRGAQFVADVLEELHLRPVQVGQQLHPLPFRLVGDGVGQRDPELPGDQREERPVLRVQRPVRVHPHHQRADRVGPAADRQRQHHRVSGVSGPNGRAATPPGTPPAARRPPRPRPVRTTRSTTADRPGRVSGVGRPGHAGVGRQPVVGDPVRPPRRRPAQERDRERHRLAAPCASTCSTARQVSARAAGRRSPTPRPAPGPPASAARTAPSRWSPSRR